MSPSLVPFCLSYFNSAIVPLSDDTPNARGHVTGQRRSGARHTSCPYIGTTKSFCDN